MSLSVHIQMHCGEWRLGASCGFLAISPAPASVETLSQKNKVEVIEQDTRCSLFMGTCNSLTPRNECTYMHRGKYVLHMLGLAYVQYFVSFTLDRVLIVHGPTKCCGKGRTRSLLAVSFSELSPYPSRSCSLPPIHLSFRYRRAVCLGP